MYSHEKEFIFQIVKRFPLNRILKWKKQIKATTKFGKIYTQRNTKIPVTWLFLYPVGYSVIKNP